MTPYFYCSKFIAAEEIIIVSWSIKINFTGYTNETQGLSSFTVTDNEKTFCLGPFRGSDTSPDMDMTSKEYLGWFL